jgi:succinate dehydrogenase/fumarate reductase cytochrome b subunit
MTSLQSLLDRLVRLQRSLGLWPLWLFAAFHMWVHWPALLGRDAWLARAEVYSPSAFAGRTVLALMALYVVLGLVRAARVWRGQVPAVVDANESAPQAAGTGTAASDVFQAITGACVALFVAYHLGQVWLKPADAGSHASLEHVHQRLWEQLGRTGPLVVYVLGSGALALHLAYGVWGLVDRHAPKAWRTPIGLAVGMLGLWVFVSYLQLVARFATGVPLLS